MSTLTVKAEQLTIHEHPNADALELAQVGLYRAVVPKGVYKTGDWALYVPEQSVLPPELIEELGLTGRLAGKDCNRVKAIRLRGELSQGIVCRPKALGLAWTELDAEETPGMGFAEILGIEKWVPPIPPEMAGEVEPAPEMIKWQDIENLQRYPDIFGFGEPVVATEKIHGTCLAVTYDARTGQLFVSSKGHNDKGLALVESERNLYWRAARAADLRAKMEKIAGYTPSCQRVAVFGEVFGAGVQDLHYGANAGSDATLGFRVFDVALDLGVSTFFIDAKAFHHYCAAYELDPVPILYSGPFDVEALQSVATGQTKIGGEHIREGVVIRPERESYSPILGGRKIAKLVSPDYLLRKGGTEFE